MAFKHPRNGPGSVPAYQLSAIPYVTGSTGGNETISSPKQFDFPSVTRFIVISNHASDGNKEVRLSFSSEGMTGTPATSVKNYFSIPGGQNVNLPVRCKTIFITTTHGIEWSMCAGMTPIAASEFPLLTGSNGFSGVGGLAT